MKGPVRISLAAVAALAAFPALAGAGSWTPSGPCGGAVPNAGSACPDAIVLAFAPASPDTFYAGTEGNGVLKSTDGGSTWQTANGGLAAATVTSLAVDPVTASTVYAVASGGVYKSTDGGDSWTPSPFGIPCIASVVSIDPENTSTLYVGMWQCDPAVWKSTDAGATWNPAGGPSGLLTSSVVLDPRSSSTLYAGGLGFLSKSTDAGGTWTLQWELGGDTVRGLAIDRTVPSTLYLATGSGVFKSTDSAATWVRKGLGTGVGPYKIVIDPSNPSALFAGSDASGVFRSTDAGETWQQASLGLPWGACCMPSVSDLLMAPSSELFATFAHSGIWRLTPAPRFFSLAPCRLFDTREATGSAAASPTLAAGESRVLAIGTRCGVPPSAKALAVNVTEAGSSTDGSLGVVRAELTSPPYGIDVPFRAGRTRSQGGILEMAWDGSRTFRVVNGASGATDFVMDVSGYFQ